MEGGPTHRIDGRIEIKRAGWNEECYLTLSIAIALRLKGARKHTRWRWFTAARSRQAVALRSDQLVEQGNQLLLLFR